MQLKDAKEEIQRYKSAFDCLRKIIKHEGMKGTQYNLIYRALQRD
jgi:uncharacterized protein YicC (UPF0701 family)